MKKVFIFFLLIIFTKTSLLSQNFSKDFINKYNEADFLIHRDDFLGALSILLPLYREQRNNANLNFLIGTCYMNLNSFDMAHPFLRRALPFVSYKYTQQYDDTTASVFTHYYLGVLNQIKFRFNEANFHFNVFNYYLNSEYGDKDSYTNIIKDLSRKVETRFNAQKHMSHIKQIRIENVGTPVNTAFPEYSPAISSDGKIMYFTARRPETTGRQLDKQGKYYEDIYFALYNEEFDRWENVENIGTGINTRGHEATISLSYDNQQLFIYKDDKGIGNIYVSRLKNEEWGKPEKLSINSNFWEGHACLSPDGKTLYFSSNRPGGIGGSDIYQSVMQANGEWSRPTNLGPTINTVYDEDAPFILSDGKTLFFASKGHDSVGGYDVFTSEKQDDGSWSEPENLGIPINTTEDDIFYYPTSDPNIFYYSSSKAGGYGDMDIYRVTVIEEVKNIAIFKGNVFDELFFRPQVAKFNVYDADSNFIKTFTTFQTSGEFYTNLEVGNNYIIHVIAEGFDTIIDNIEIPNLETSQVITRTYLLRKEGSALADLMYEEEEIEVEYVPQVLYFEDIKEIAIGDKIILKNIFFDFDRSTLRPESIEELTRLIDFLEKRPTLRIEISGHTDNRGSERYNKRLSEQRAKTVVDYLIDKGIALDRLEFAGYGFDEPIADNDTDEGRQMNRRTEFKVIGL